jgi:hypothetical protein
MNRLLQENVISLQEAAHSIPGGEVASSTPLRWITRGCRGVRLEAFRRGSRWFTSREALARFFARLNEPVAV